MSIFNRFFTQTAALLLSVGLLALAAIVGANFWLSERAQVYFDEAIASRDLRGAAVELRNAIQTAESSQRGFLFTGNQIYLAPFDPAKSLALRRLQDVERMLSALEGNKVSVDRLKAVISEKFREIEQTIELKQNRRDDEALAIVRTNRGKALMDETNVFLSGIIRSADDRLTEGVLEQNANAALLRLVSIIAGIVIVLVIGSAALIGFRYARVLQIARDEVCELNVSLEDRVRARTRDLAEANEEIQRFMHIITHDLRAPLISIVGFTGEIDEQFKKLGAASSGKGVVAPETVAAALEDVPEAIQFIRSSTGKMDRLIGALLKLSREGKRRPQPETIDLVPLIEASLASIQHQLMQADGNATIRCEKTSIVSDRLSLEQIFGNLLDNAVKYRSAERALTIAIRARSLSDDKTEFEVEDNGRGIAENDRQRVFELFKRSGVQDQAGEGVGLAYVMATVRNLGGDIEVDSTLAHGTVFRVVLPNVLTINEAADAKTG